MGEAKHGAHLETLTPEAQRHAKFLGKQKTAFEKAMEKRELHLLEEGMRLSVERSDMRRQQQQRASWRCTWLELRSPMSVWRTPTRRPHTSTRRPTGRCAAPRSGARLRTMVTRAPGAAAQVDRQHLLRQRIDKDEARVRLRAAPPVATARQAAAPMYEQMQHPGFWPGPRAAEGPELPRAAEARRASEAV